MFHDKLLIACSGIEYETPEDTVRIYTQYVLQIFPRYKGYEPMNIVLNKHKTIIALQLKNLLYIPVKKAQTTEVTLPAVEVDEFEYELNRDILFGKDEQFKELEKKVLEKKEIEEIYQHLRLTFSKWLDSKGTIAKHNLENDIIFNSTISLNDKRRRFITLFAPLIQSWFSKEKNETNILNSEEVIVEEEISSDKEKINQEKIVESENIKLKEKVNKPKTKVLPKVSISEQYKYAMNIMKSGDFEKAEIAFKEFVDTHSKHELAGSAQFWYAETFYIRQLYDDAAVAFLEGYQKYPNSPKAPENLLKLGVTLAELGEIDQGCKMIMNLKKAYPKTDASILQKSSYEKKRFNCS